MDARERILVAFRSLVLAERFDDLTAHEVIRQAGVARSTFYAHFRGKNDLLLASLAPILEVLGAACRGRADRARLISTLEHVWENRAVARVMFRGPMSDRLAGEVVRGLEREGGDAARHQFLAHGLLGVLGAWVSGQLAITVEELAAMLPALAAAAETPSSSLEPIGPRSRQ